MVVTTLSFLGASYDVVTVDLDVVTLSLEPRPERRTLTAEEAWVVLRDAVTPRAPSAEKDALLTQPGCPRKVVRRRPTFASHTRAV